VHLLVDLSQPFGKIHTFLGSFSGFSRFAGRNIEPFRQFSFFCRHFGLWFAGRLLALNGKFLQPFRHGRIFGGLDRIAGDGLRLLLEPLGDRRVFGGWFGAGGGFRFFLQPRGYRCFFDRIFDRACQWLFTQPFGGRFLVPGGLLFADGFGRLFA